MGYPKIANFDKTIIRRTKQNLENYSGSSDFTFLLSQCLALIILPIEFYKKGARMEYDFLKNKVDRNQRLKSIFDCTRDVALQNEDGSTTKRKKAEFKTNQGKKKTTSDVDIQELFFKIRNSIAHWGVTPVKSGDHWVGIILKNVNKKKITTMDVYVAESELKELCIYVGEKWEQCAK